MLSDEMKFDDSDDSKMRKCDNSSQFEVKITFQVGQFVNCTLRL